MPVRGNRIGIGAQGFTLMELLVVISVMAVLMSLLFPAVRAAVTSARRTSCMSNLQTIAQQVAMYRQDQASYPEPPNVAGRHGIPQGGVTGLALANSALTADTFWCDSDPFPAQYDTKARPAPERGLHSSSYQYGYNYYGYVTSTDGTPFPITTAEAAEYFYGAGDEAWNLKLTEHRNDEVRPRSLFQGLWNVQAPSETIITYCPHHTAGKRGLLAAVTVAGEAHFITPVKPRDVGGNSYTLSCAAPRRPTTGQEVAPIDWRIHKAPLNRMGAVSGRLFGDALGETTARTMPVVEVIYRQFGYEDLTADSGPWYDTGIVLQPDDRVMIMANARWRWTNTDIAAGWNKLHTPPYGNYASEYEMLCDNIKGSAMNLWFTADGDPIEMAHPDALLTDSVTGSAKNFVLQYGTSGSDSTAKKQPHSVLVGRIGESGDAFRVGSHAFFSRPSDADPETLYLTTNDLKDNAEAFTDNHGWCEVWIAVYSPPATP